MKRQFKIFIVFWSVIFVLSFFTAKAEMGIIQRVGYTMALALVAPFLMLSSKDKGQSKGKNSFGVIAEIFEPNSPKIVYRVRKDGKIYKGMEKSPVYVIKGHKVYENLSSKVCYRIEGNKIYHGMEVSPLFEIRDNKICNVLSNKVVYEIKRIL